MSWTTEPTTDNGITERDFVIEGPGGPVPGVSWSPAGGPADRLLLLGHGGTTDKRADYIRQVARLAVGHGMEAVAIDGPGHGDRTLPGLTPGPDSFFEVWNQGGGTDGIVADWRATLDFVESQHGARPAGWWGLSMGTMMGLPVTVADDRITVAVLGLMGRWGPNGDDLMRLAPEIGCPLRFLVQWDDEIVPRAACLELFDALGSARKTLHANPGVHAAVPAVEVVASVEYLDRYLD
ncbi:MAG: alpha/beta fold hydrolase [Acidimicrobiales bacterium]